MTTAFLSVVLSSERGVVLTGHVDCTVDIDVALVLAVKETLFSSNIVIVKVAVKFTGCKTTFG